MASSLPWYARQQNYKSLKQSSFDRTGGNSDRWPIPPGATQELFSSDGPGIITHIWFTIAAESPNHLKEVVIRGYCHVHIPRLHHPAYRSRGAASIQRGRRAWATGDRHHFQRCPHLRQPIRGAAD